MMIMARAEKDLQKARKIAEQICKIQPDEEDACHDIAKQILADSATRHPNCLAMQANFL